MEKFSEAKDCFFKAEELGIRDENMFYFLAYIFYMESDFEMALHYIDKAFRGNNKNRDYYESKAEILLKLGRKEEAEKCFQKAKQLDENKQKHH
ncbi:MAG: tetratricopeptide repeat protein [Candidatus Gastranaerophilaceae bacterium]